MPTTSSDRPYHTTPACHLLWSCCPCLPTTCACLPPLPSRARAAPTRLPRNAALTHSPAFATLTRACLPAIRQHRRYLASLSACTAPPCHLFGTRAITTASSSRLARSRLLPADARHSATFCCRPHTASLPRTTGSIFYYDSAYCLPRIHQHFCLAQRYSTVFILVRTTCHTRAT